MSEISSQYAIHRYVGREPLNLLEVPDTEYEVVWNRLINNVLTIYATEITDGSIPFFYTSLSDDNTSERIPNTNSTLTSLTPGHSYYFITRSQANLPIVLPEIGGKIIGCDLPECSRIEIEEISDINLVGKNNNKQFINVCVSGLTCGEKYSFDFSSSISNWPTYVSPISGEFVAFKENIEIPAEITFSKETGNLDSKDLLNYKIYTDMNYHPCHTEDFNVYSVIKASIRPVSYDGLHDEDIFKIHCIDCLPECDPYATVKFVDSPVKILEENCCQENHNLVIDVTEARLGELYEYKFITDSLKPVSITPATGTVGFGKYYNYPVVSTEAMSNKGGGQINALFNLMQNTDAIVKIELKHKNTGSVSTDFLTIACSGCY